MRITVRGWGRDQGEKEIMDAPLEVAVPGPDKTYSQGRTYLNIVHPEARWLTKVRVSTSTKLRLGGRYLLHVELSRKEIAQLFYETHGNDIVRMVRSFIEDEERQETARMLQRWAERDERRRQRVAQEETEKQSEPK
jgi:hypothetical protein